MLTVSFTGHRPEKLPFFSEDDPMFVDFMERLKSQIEKAAIDGAEYFCSGMALGTDTWCAEIVLELKEKYPQIKLCAVLPCRNQTERWSAENKARYDSILSRCDKIMYTGEKYTRYCMLKRDRALAEMCDVLIAVYDNGKSGKSGTGYTIEQARKLGKKIIIVPIM